ncbi:MULTISPECIES: glycoside hydrolase family 3 C-terminal domain-containing protein [Alteromonas]|uniref:Beta-glucosidase n=1 Tax=Alteromonas stellipolaris TaxID=233316 RepID=A0ABN4LHZ0_9ALTE|nr:glycoside hydrolase family 3 C-terminal domain-containing protein [Alteromonas stellipolaris]ALM91669.1 Beta-glucosidase [Alteromonas stellipolaris LMG 21856]AMJ73459.1 beta-glucosidase [Alteromonas stellipolaris]
MNRIIKKLPERILISACFLLTSHSHAETLPFQNQSLPVETRVADLVDRLTLEEKVSQLFDKSAAIERLAIPEYYWWNEALHGIARAGKATVFPQAIGMAATFDEPLIYRIASTISDEGRAKHHEFLREDTNAMYGGLTYWSPNINIFRDPRWGRGQETYGEDPFLTSRMAVNFVKGLEGQDPTYLKSVATLKHYAVHSGPEVSRHSDDYAASEKDLTETYLRAFEDTIAATNISSVMCAYNRVNGSPACGSEALLQNTLRDKFNFSGYVVSDCGAIADFYDENSHHVVDSPAQAAASALKSGTDLNCGDHHGNTFSYLIEAVAEDLVEESDIDQALTRLLTARMKLGMFDNSSTHAYTKMPMSVVGSKNHLELAREAAEKSMVLLKNDGVLPLKRNSKIALIGPNADNPAILVGNYHGTPVQPVTPKEAFSQALPSNQIGYAPGSSITENIFTHFSPVPSSVFTHVNMQGESKPGLVAKYYPSSHFNLQPSKRHVEMNINLKSEDIPFNKASNQEFAVRWTGKITPQESGNYYFKMKNVEVYLDGELTDESRYLEAGRSYDFKAESLIRRFWHSNVIEPEISFNWLIEDKNLDSEALRVAKESDVIVFVGGISAELEGEEMPLEIDGFSHGDRTNIKLPESQSSLLKALHKLGKPMVMVNMSGSAIALNWEDKNLNAIIQGFYPGEQTGPALLNLLYGDTSPSGRLPVTFYSSVDDLPDFKNYNMVNRTYKYYEGTPLYPFGYGLSYADFRYDKLKITRSEKGLNIATTLSNKSDISAQEVVQVYLGMPDAPIRTPQRELVAFKRVNLAGGESQSVKFTINESQLVYVDEQGQRQPYKGKLLVTLGGGQGVKRSDNVVQHSINLP